MIDEILQLIDLPELGKTGYLNVVTRDLIISEISLQESDTLKRIPSKKELCTYLEAFAKFCEVLKIAIPDGKRPSEWLRAEDYYQVFVAFYVDILRDRLQRWLDETLKGEEYAYFTD